MLNVPLREHTFQDSEKDDKISVDVEQNSKSESIYDKQPSLLADPSDANQPRFFWKWRKRRAFNLDTVATQPSVFDDPLSADIYRPPPAYENAHRFDPRAHGGHGAKNRLWFGRSISGSTMGLFFAFDLNRENISQANSDNFLTDLGMTTNDYNLGNTLFRLSFLIAELPSQSDFDRMSGYRMTLWNIVAFSQYWISGRSSFLATRCLLGFLEGGYIPDVVLYYYTNTCQDGLFLAVKLSDVSTFLATGCLTLAIGLASFLLVQRRQKRGIDRKGGSQRETREEIIMVNRVLRGDPSKSDMHNREGLSIRMIWEALCDWRMWPLYCLGLGHQIPTGPPRTYLTLSLRNLMFSTTETNLLTIPSSVIGMTNMIITAYLSEIINNRVLATVILQSRALPLLIALYTFTKQTSQWVYFAVVAWASRNSFSVRTRTVSASIYNMFVQAGAIVIANIYRADDKHLYKRGNRDLIAICCMNIAMYTLTYFFYKSINKRQDRVWSSWTSKEQQEY